MSHSLFFSRVSLRRSRGFILAKARRDFGDHVASPLEQYFFGETKRNSRISFSICIFSALCVHYLLMKRASTPVSIAVCTVLFTVGVLFPEPAQAGFFDLLLKPFSGVVDLFRTAAPDDFNCWKCADSLDGTCVGHNLHLTGCPDGEFFSEAACEASGMCSNVSIDGEPEEGNCWTCIGSDDGSCYSFNPHLTGCPAGAFFSIEACQASPQCFSERDGDGSPMIDKWEEDYCPIFDCAAPPPGCRYGPPPMKGDCPDGCGELICEDLPPPLKDLPRRCPIFDCQAPPPAPPGCRYGPPPVRDGCPIGCNELICEDLAPPKKDKEKEPKECDKIFCEKPPPHCKYVDRPVKDDCPIGCGTLICDKPAPPKEDPRPPQKDKKIDSSPPWQKDPPPCKNAAELDWTGFCSSLKECGPGRCCWDGGGAGQCTAWQSCKDNPKMRCVCPPPLPPGGDPCMSNADRIMWHKDKEKRPEPDKPAPPRCPIFDCPAPPPGCTYGDAPIKDDCPYGCGEVLCKEPPPKKPSAPPSKGEPPKEFPPNVRTRPVPTNKFFDEQPTSNYFETIESIIQGKTQEDLDQECKSFLSEHEPQLARKRMYGSVTCTASRPLSRRLFDNLLASLSRDKSMSIRCRVVCNVEK